MLKVSAFYLEKQKSFFPKIISLRHCQYQNRKLCLPTQFSAKVLGTGSTPCLNNGGIYPHASKYAFMASMKSIGSKNIFTSTADAVFSGTPLPSKQI